MNDEHTIHTTRFHNDYFNNPNYGKWIYSVRFDGVNMVDDLAFLHQVQCNFSEMRAHIGTKFISLEVNLCAPE